VEVWIIILHDLSNLPHHVFYPFKIELLIGIRQRFESAFKPGNRFFKNPERVFFKLD
jgi:hypothetical protein